ncbi:uracil-DNA glycosylase [Gordonia sp. VNQ95]|uniref:uracil-DNA glycosylase n=1 Tax=Gordonia sp. VNQ95 TaxID=3156619 RepID=UPI0032B3DAE8
MGRRRTFTDIADITDLDAAIVECRACRRLVAWRERVAREKRAAFADQTYWGRAVPGFGPADAAMLILGLAPAAHGANRTGRMFTGDQSGDVLFRALYDVGLASRPDAISADDGMELFGVRMTAPVHCAPPQNQPTPAERDRCSRWLAAELALLRPTLRSVLVLGGFGWQVGLRTFADLGWDVARPRPKFGHGARTVITDGDDHLTVVGSYHVSQHNTFTGRLTPAMLREVIVDAARIAGLPTLRR